VQGGGCFVAGLSLSLLGTLALAATLSSPMAIRGVGLVLAVVASLLFAVYLFVRFRHLSADQAVARLVATQRPALRSDLISTVELGGEVARGGARFSTALYSALAERTWEELAARPAATVAPARRLRSTAMLLCGAVLAWAVTATSAGEAMGRGAALLFGTSELDEGRTAPGPLVGDLRLTYRYPKHTGRAPRVVVSSTGDILAPQGTLVEVSATALMPVTAANLRLRLRGRPPTRQALVVKQSTVSGRLTVVGEGTYRFELQGPALRAVLEPSRHAIDLEVDAFPRAQLFGPRNDLEVTRRHRLEIGYTVEDDYGLTAVELVYQVGSLPSARIPLWRAGSGERRRTTAESQCRHPKGFPLFRCRQCE